MVGSDDVVVSPRETCMMDAVAGAVRGVASDALTGVAARFRSSSAPAPLSRDNSDAPWDDARRRAAHKME
eukprot:gene7178-6607_t